MAKNEDKKEDATPKPNPDRFVFAKGLRMLNTVEGNVSYPIRKDVVTEIPNNLFKRLSRLSPPAVELE